MGLPGPVQVADDALLGEPAGCLVIQGPAALAGFRLGHGGRLHPGWGRDDSSGLQGGVPAGANHTPNPSRGATGAPARQP
jgi:hypothetical protein